MQKGMLSKVGLVQVAKELAIDQHTKILDKTKPGVNPATKGTSAVANDQVNTPISRTFLHQKKTIKGALHCCPENEKIHYWAFDAKW